MYIWFSNFEQAMLTLKTRGSKLVAWPYLGSSYGVKWAVFIPGNLL